MACMCMECNLDRSVWHLWWIIKHFLQLSKSQVWIHFLISSEWAIGCVNPASWLPWRGWWVHATWGPVYSLLCMYVLVFSLSDNAMLLHICWGKRRNITKSTEIVLDYMKMLHYSVVRIWLVLYDLKLMTDRSSIKSCSLLNSSPDNVFFERGHNGFYWFSQFSGPTFDAMRNSLWLQIPLTKLVTEICVPHMLLISKL